MRVLLPALLFLLVGCRGQVRPDELPVRPRIPLEQATPLLPPNVKDAQGWAQDILAALDAHNFPADVSTFCQVAAVIEQESGFQADPAVPDLSKLVQAYLEKKSENLGPLGKVALNELLSGKAPGSKLTFDERLKKLRTERDLDLLFRDILAYYEDKFPASYRTVDVLGVLFGKRPEAFNPVTTVGSMQVSVDYSVKLAEQEKREPKQVRDELYTRAGGVYYGAHRLLAHPAAYAQPLFRFADYNAGVYASRNAAVQEQVSKLLGIQLAPDGDLLAYDEEGEALERDTNSLKALLAFRVRYAPELSESRVRKDVQQEKAAAFEGTETWRAIKRAYAQKFAVDPPYARVPDVALSSVKMKSPRSTAWFAKNVDARYHRCLERAKAP